MQAPSRQALVLICEDSDEYATMEEHLLERQGHLGRRVSDLAFLEEVRLHQPGMVIVGLTSTGARLELVSDLRASPCTRGRSVLVTTPRGRVTRQGILLVGANAVLWKPFAPEGFLREVVRLSSVPKRVPVRRAVLLRPRSVYLDPYAATTLDVSLTGTLVHSEGNLRPRLPLTLETGERTLPCSVAREAAERGPGHFGLTFHADRELVGAAFDLEGGATW